MNMNYYIKLSYPVLYCGDSRRLLQKYLIGGLRDNNKRHNWIT